MQKGTYSVFIGMMAIIIAISILAFSSSNQQQETLVYKNTAFDTKKTANNAVLLLDKVLNDAIADTVFANRCSETNAKINESITAYFNSAMQNFRDCSVAINGITRDTTIISGETVYITDFSVQCTSAITGKFDMLYKERKAFQRHATQAITGTTCTIEVFDGATRELQKTGSMP